MTRVFVRAGMCSLALVVLLALPGVAAAVPPDNDSRGDAIEITPGDFLHANNDDATVNPNGEALTASNGGTTGCEPDGTAGPTGNQLTKTVWWEFTGTGERLTVSTKLSDFDTIAAVYTEDEQGFLVFEGCNDDAGPDDLGSEVVVDTDPGVEYWIQVGGCDQCNTDDSGNIDISLDEPPDNDHSSAARPLQLRTTADEFTFGALSDSPEALSCRVGTTTVRYDKTVWFRVQIPSEGTVTVNGSGFPLVVSLFRTNLQRTGCAFGSGSNATLTQRLPAGTYLVQVGGRGEGVAAEDGRLALRVDHGPIVRPEPDRDRDGIIDRLDRCPDQNSSARDANRDGCLDPDPDPDRDGVPVGTDRCPAENAAARDANRDGCLDPAPPKELKADASLRATPTATGIRVRSLSVTAPRGARVLVRCGRRCRFARRAVISEDVLATAARLVKFKRLAGRNFRAGTRIRIYVTKRKRIGKYFEYRVTRGNFRKKERCLNPGSRRPRACP